MSRFSELLDLFNQHLEENKLTGNPQSLYDPCNYLLAVGGKRFRPVLALMAHELYSDLTEGAYSLAKAIELFHNFSLMHDDIMDEAPLRRGKDSVHIKYDIPTAILSGDLMLIEAYKQLANCQGGLLPDFNTMAEDVCRGQQMDMEFEKRDDVVIDEYLEMIKLKTAVLLGFSLKAGATVGGAPKEEADLLYEYGLRIGRGFQLADDYLDTFGSQAKVGKRIGGDILEAKKTYLMIKARSLGNNSQLVALDSSLSNPSISDDEKVAQVTALFTELGVDTMIKEAIDQEFRAAEELLVKLKKDTTELEKLVGIIYQREH